MVTRNAACARVRVSYAQLEGTSNEFGVLKRMAFGFVRADNFATRGILRVRRLRLDRPQGKRRANNRRWTARSTLAPNATIRERWSQLRPKK